jgi:hypothetical protein
MPTVPTPEELGSLLHMPGSRPIGSYDVSPYAHGAQQIADAGTRFGQAVEDVGKATYKISQRQAMTEAVNANAFIHGRLIEARSRYQNDPDYATLAQRWNEEAGKIVEDGLSQISNEGLREHVRSNLAAPIAQESAAIQNQAFHGTANAHAASRDRYLGNLVQHITLNPSDSLITGGVDSLHSAIDDAVSRGFLTPEQASEEKRRGALALCTGQYARMSRIDPERAIRELESPEGGHPLIAQLPQPLKDSLIQQARQQQDNNLKDAEHAAVRHQQEIQRASDQAESEIVTNLTSEKPTLTRADIADNQRLTQPAKAYMLALEDRAANSDPDAATSNAAARQLLDRIRLRDGDPNKIVRLDPIYDAYINNRLSRGDFSFVRKEFFAKQTPEGDLLLAHKQAFLKGIAHEIDQSDPLIGEIDQLGRSKMYLLERDIDRKIDQYHKDGKDPFDLFDRSKPDYVGKPESLERYRTTLGETLEERARQLRSTAAPSGSPAAQSIPQRLSGETPADYLKRTNAVMPDAKVRVPLSR